MKDCLGKYYYQYIEKPNVKRNTWSTTIFGEIIHEQIDLFLKKYQIEASFKKEVDKIISKSKIKFEQDFLKKHELHFEKIFEETLARYKKEKIKVTFTRKFPTKTFLEFGDKWGPEVLKFIVRYLNINEQFENEKEFSIQIPKEFLSKKTTIKMSGIYDHKREEDIVDFKTTSMPEKYYFVDWDRDIQSLLYYFSFKEESGRYPKSFTYVVFNILDSMFFVVKHDYANTKESIDIMKKNFKQYIDYFLEKHDVSSDNSNWNPEVTRCKFCDYNKICKAKIDK